MSRKQAHTAQEESSSDPLNSTIEISDVHGRYPGVFGSEPSVRWFLRKHRQELLDEEALIVIAGRIRINTSRFGPAVLKIGAANARKAVA